MKMVLKTWLLGPLVMMMVMLGKGQSGFYL